MYRDAGEQLLAFSSVSFASHEQAETLEKICLGEVWDTRIGSATEDEVLSVARLSGRLSWICDDVESLARLILNVDACATEEPHVAAKDIIDMGQQRHIASISSLLDPSTTLGSNVFLWTSS